MHKTSPIAGVFLALFLFTIGCGTNPDSEDNAARSAFKSIEPDAPSDDSSEPETPMLTADELREALGANDNAQFQKAGTKFVIADLTNSGVKTLDPLKDQPIQKISLARTTITDLSPLKGLPIEFFDGTGSAIDDISFLEGNTRLTELLLEGAKVSDISPLKSCPLNVLWLNGCPVEDLSVLEGKNLEQLNLCDTPLEDLSTVKTMKLGTLWMRNTNVKELGPLANHGLVSLDVEGSSVNDISALSKMTSLKRLNIARTEITDLSPLSGLSLERIIFTPGKIEKGIDAIRSMPSLQAIDTSFDGVARPMNPSEFWERFDSGDFKAES